VIRSVRRLAAVLAVLLLALMANLTYLQFGAANSLRARSGNTRVILEEYNRERGPILLGSQPIASSIPTDDQLKYLRQYSDGPLYAPATGFYSIVYGATGIEKAENSVLSGSDDRFFVDRIQQLFTGRGIKGGAVRLTLDPRRRRRRTTASRAAQAPSSRWTRAPGRSSRWRPRRRSTPTCSPATTPARSARPTAPTTQTPPSRCSTARSR
jgi:hypothetical protein